MKKLLVMPVLALGMFSWKVSAQAYFNGSVSEAVSGAKLKNVKIMVINNRDTSYFNVGADGKYNITTKEGKNRIFAIADGYITELNSMEAAKGSVNKVDISMVSKTRVETDVTKRARYEIAHAPSTTDDESRPYEIKTGIPSKTPPPGAMYKALSRSPGSVGVMPGYPVASSGAAGKLTAGNILDFGKWKMWSDFHEGIFQSFARKYKNNVSRGDRYTVQVTTPAGVPVVDAAVVLKSGTSVIWTARTDNTGKAELWAKMDEKASKVRLTAEVTAFGKTENLGKIQPFEKGINFWIMDGPCSMADQLDVAFVVDATGSMGDEIHHLKMDLDTFIKTIAIRNKDINLRLGSVFYRDQGDEYVYRISPFSSNSHVTDNFILDQMATGGGDYPEALDQALKQAVLNMNWSSTARARIIFLMLDAPCHPDEPTYDTLQKYVVMAAAKGIRIVPVACSGTDKFTEFMLRNIALQTNGKYLFLTNHSGIGNPHIEPSTDIYSVRSLLDEMLAVTSEFSIVPDCQKYLDANAIYHTDSLRVTADPFSELDSMLALKLSAKDSAAFRDSAILRERGRYGAISWVKIYPNPTVGPLTINVQADIREVFIADIGGKLLQRFSCKKGDVLTPDLSNYSSGIYFVKYPTANGWVAERIVLRR
ncbi:MAG: T9SS type A sorting domain-containing protein [Sphingomonadales bacterium]